VKFSLNSILWLDYNNLFHGSQANAASSAEEDGEDMDDAEEQKPTVLKVKLFNK
jgi:hypothetical protein